MRALVAGFGNIFFGDDGYGPAVARLLAAQPFPPQVRVTDFGIRGMHAAFEMLDGYDVVVLIDAVPRGGAPGTLYVIDPSDRADEAAGATAPDAHAMELHNALALYERLAKDLLPEKRPKIVIVGCEPESTGEGMVLSEAVAAAVPATLPLVRKILAQHAVTEPTYEAK